MAGVAGPMIEDRPLQGARFLLGLTTGAVAAGLMVGMAAYVVGAGVTALVAEGPRLVILAGGCLALGVLDLCGRPPHIWRQVPQALVRVLPPGFLGAVWGFDIGLLFTTQKVSSLLWAPLVAVILLAPAQAPAMLIGIAVLSCLTITAMSVTGRSGVVDHGKRRERRWLMSLRGLSGLLLLAMAGATLVQGALM
jgi:hypothetical protein